MTTAMVTRLCHHSDPSMDGVFLDHVFTVETVNCLSALTSNTKSVSVQLAVEPSACGTERGREGG